MSHDPRTLLTEMFQAAIAAASAERSVPRHLPPPKGRTIVIGAGCMVPRWTSSSAATKVERL